jgi:hypothetical protein
VMYVLRRFLSSAIFTVRIAHHLNMAIIAILS